MNTTTKDRQPREHAVLCVYCRRFTWNRQPVCDNDECQRLEVEYLERKAEKR